MSNYNVFARFYDELTENVDYKVRSSYISGFFSRYGKGKGSVLDLACGTGSVAEHLSEEGYRVTGLDLSDEMLTVASGKNIQNAVFVKGNMTDFLLPEKVDYCVCALDSMNHLTHINDVKSCFQAVYRAMNSGGIFVFDVNTIYKHQSVLADNTFVFDEEDYFLSWDNELLEDNCIRILLDFFIYNGVNYDRFSEEIIEKAYTVDELKSALSDNFEIIGIYDELTENAPRTDSERIYFVCKRK